MMTFRFRGKATSRWESRFVKKSFPSWNSYGQDPFGLPWIEVIILSRRIAIGDIHGCSNTLKGLLEEKIRIRAEDQIIFVGDYIDRGPDSKGVLDYVIGLREKVSNLVFIRGNHEEMLIESFFSQIGLHMGAGLSLIWGDKSPPVIAIHTSSVLFNFRP